MQDKSRKEWEFVSTYKEVKYFMQDESVWIMKLPIDMNGVHGVFVFRMEMEDK